MPTNIHPSLCLNSLWNELSLSANKYTTGSIGCIHFENFKLSMISTIACKVSLIFHHSADKSSYNTTSYTLVPNQYYFFSDIVMGEKVFLEVDTLGNAISSTDTIKINTHFTAISGHLNTT